MRSDRLLIAGFALLLLIGFGAGGYWLLGGQSVTNTPSVQPVAMHDPDTRSPAPSSASRAPALDQPQTPESSVDAAASAQADADAAQAPTSQPAKPQTQPSKPAEGDATADEDLAAQEAGLDSAEREELVVETKSRMFRLRIAGRVMDEIGRSVGNATLTVSVVPTDPAHDRIMRLLGAQIPPVTTSDEGRFDAWLEFEVPEGVEAVNATIQSSSRTFAAGDPVSIEAARNGSEHTNLEVVMKTPATLIGRVVDRSMKPIEGAAVYVISRPRVGESRPTQMLTNSNGEFRFNNLAAGKWAVTVTSSRHSVLDAPPEIELTAGTETRLPEVVMVPTTVLRLRILRNDGSPLSTDGRPVPVTIKFVLDGGRPSSSAVPCDAEGNVTIHRVPGDAREYTVSVRGFQDSEKQYLNSLRWDEENDGGEIRLTPVQR